MAAQPAREGRFTTGSTMRHVTVMTLTGAVGLTFMFLVDFATLLYVSMLGDATLTAAVGYAWTIQFFTISAGIGFTIAATALVSRELGARNREAARRRATSAFLTTTAALAVTAAVVLILREPILRLLGAQGETLEVASRFLLISVPSLVVMGAGMTGSGILRAEGDARRAMMVTLSAGSAAMILDPLFIFDDVLGVPGLGLGVDGAAWAVVLSRALTAVFGLWFVIRVHDLAAPVRLRAWIADLRAILKIAAPATLTQMSTPFGNFLLTAAVATHGDDAVAGWSVASRMTVLAFGGIFALSGAIGGILGQNHGAGRMDRVRRAYRDALVFCTVYVLATWAILWLASDLIARGFSLGPDGTAVVRAFATVGAGAFIFAGALFVANAAFNNLGRPGWSTAFNWARDGAAIPLMLLVFTGLTGAVWAQAAANVALGLAAAWWSTRWLASLEAGGPRAAPAASAPPAPLRGAAGALAAALETRRRSD